MVKKSKKNNIEKLLYLIIILLLICSCISKKHVSDIEVSRQVNTKTKTYEQKEKTDSNEEYTEIVAYGDTSVLAKLTPYYIDVKQKNKATKSKQNEVANTLKPLATIKITTKSNKKTITANEEHAQNDSIFKDQEKSDQRDLEKELKKFGGNFHVYIIIFSLVVFLCWPNLSSLFKKILAYFKKIK